MRKIKTKSDKPKVHKTVISMKEAIALTKPVDMIYFTLFSTNEMLYKYAINKDVCYVEEYEKKFLEAYKTNCKLLDKMEEFLDLIGQKTVIGQGAKAWYLELLEQTSKRNKYLDIKIENVKGIEKEDLLLYFTISANIDICDNLIKKFQYSEYVLDKEKKWLEITKYFTYTKIKLYTILGIIRDEYNSGVEEGGIKIGKRSRRVSKITIG